MSSGDKPVGPLARFSAWRGPTTPLVSVTSLFVLAAALAACLDVLSPTPRWLPAAVEWAVIGLAALVALVNLALGDKVSRPLGYVSVVVITLVCALSVVSSQDALLTANALLFPPMIATYLGWFFPPWLGRSTLGGVLALLAAAVVFRPYPDVATTWVTEALVSVFCLEAIGYLRARLVQRAATDTLTGVLNRAGLQPIIDRELDRAARTAEPFAIAMVDLDDLKVINDTEGHHAGDRILRELVDEWRRHLRPFDTIARLGGDEFLIVLPGADFDAGVRVMRRLARHSAYSWSFGVASSRAEDSAETIIQRADRRMYVHKAREEQLDDPVETVAPVDAAEPASHAEPALPDPPVPLDAPALPDPPPPPSARPLL